MHPDFKYLTYLLNPQPFDLVFSIKTNLLKWRAKTRIKVENECMQYGK